MYPEMGSSGFPTYFITMGVSACAGIALAVLLATRSGLSGSRALGASGVLGLLVIVGSMMQFQVEKYFALLEVPFLLEFDSSGAYAKLGLRLPGGILLASVVAPLICRASNLPTIKFMDSVFPALIGSVSFMRVGCFLHGCCFGRVSEHALSIAFPRGAFVSFMIGKWHPD